MFTSLEHAFLLFAKFFLHLAKLRYRKIVCDHKTFPPTSMGFETKNACISRAARITHLSVPFNRNSTIYCPVFLRYVPLQMFFPVFDLNFCILWKPQIMREISWSLWPERIRHNVTIFTRRWLPHAAAPLVPTAQLARCSHAAGVWAPATQRPCPPPANAPQ